MSQRIFIAAGIVVLGAVACTPAEQTTDQVLAQATKIRPSSSPELVKLLVDRLGVDSKQALGGVGSIFALAQQRMNPEDFMQLSGNIPDMDRYLAAVPSPASSFRLGGAERAMTGEAGRFGRLAALSGPFRDLGMGVEMIDRFVPLLLLHLREQSGPAVVSLLQNALY